MAKVIKSKKNKLSPEEKFWTEAEEKSKIEIDRLLDRNLPVEWRPQDLDLEKSLDWRAIAREDIPNKYENYDWKELEINTDYLAQKIEQEKEMKQALSASKKTMSKWILFLIIFLLEYAVCKKNGIKRAIILNSLLALAYYKKQSILQTYDLWENYALIIGYVLGNFLAYSAPEKQKYKWPSLLGFNAIVAGIYDYTYYQQQGINQRITHLQSEIEKEVGQKQEEFNQAERKKQAEYLQQQQAIIETLREITNNPISSAIKIDELEARVPGIKQEYQRVKDWLKGLIPKTNQEKNSNELSEILNKVNLSEENLALLLDLNLSDQQIINLAKRIPQLENIDIEASYSALNNQQKSQLIELSLKHLNLNSLSNKKVLIAIRQQKTSGETNFDLSVEEKENLLTFFIDGLQLTAEQKKEFESNGVNFVNANNWQITEQQKEKLLKPGLAKIKFNETEKKKLFNNPLNFYQLNPNHKQIINSLSPLVKEFKYSRQLLAKITTLNISSNTINILTNEEIIPNPRTDFTKPITLIYL